LEVSGECALVPQSSPRQNARLRNSQAATRRAILNIAVVAPISKSSVSTAAAVKPGDLREDAGSEASVLRTRLQEEFPAARANDFLADFEASTLQADCAKGFFAAQAALHLLFGSHLLIGPKLFIQLPVDLFLSE
jgi:hypothetical protein